ncbi:UNVERIFIED_CONTAM: hypothetical protein FKN15_040220 [Acipenser sinensis]
MSILISARNLLLALSLMLVLGFLYYSSGKLHMRGWGQESLSEPCFTRVIFSTPAEPCTTVLPGEKYLSVMWPVQVLYMSQYVPVHSLYLLSTSTIKQSQRELTTRFIKPAPMFLDRNFKRLSRIGHYLPPFGVKTQALRIHSEATRPIVLEDNTDLMAPLQNRRRHIGHGSLVRGELWIPLPT